ncbi:MAG TPA: hypothetical protein VH040_04195 [Usitatibacter sp.]|jgi:hypothetical protein|nr:hypothetical protein [Usitatibacter sp.]
MVGGIEGTYTTVRDGGITYTYQAECGMQGGNWHWNAIVRCSDQLRGEPKGVIYDPPSFIEEPVLRGLVELAIENRVGVE